MPHQDESGEDQPNNTFHPIEPVVDALERVSAGRTLLPPAPLKHSFDDLWHRFRPLPRRKFVLLRH